MNTGTDHDFNLIRHDWTNGNVKARLKAALKHNGLVSLS